MTAPDAAERTEEQKTRAEISEPLTGVSPESESKEGRSKGRGVRNRDKRFLEPNSLK